ncbi:MAG: TetR/AcrR family transcriptional regulator [candidate division Zixibacteria bacterium]|nr:TetR/AcrR family transcriptional regulator [candidate division Zixibacteria bacterium]
MTNRTPNRKAQIVRAATDLFSRHGFDRVTIKELAQACDITEPAVYRHFKSKDDIYDAVLDSMAERMKSRDLFDSLTESDDVEVVLHKMATHVIDFFTRNEDMHRLLLYSALHKHAKASKVYEIMRGSFVKFLHDQLDRLYGQKMIVKKNNEITARCFVGMVFECALGRTLWKGMQGKTYKPADVIANNVPIYARGLKR